VLTKGYDFANIFLESGARSEIPSVVSDWEVAAGVAQAKVVMMTTKENRIALKGGLDVPGESFNNVSIALLDEAGCARVEQSIRGTFQDPVIEKPTVLRSLTGPLRALIEKLLPGDECVPFYPEASATE
jgi:AsmA protein